MSDDSTKEPSKQRRPLPNPAAQPNRPETPVSAPVSAVPTPIPPATFYGTDSASNPPPLPTRPKGAGSNHTATYFIPETEQPPLYDIPVDDKDLAYREPELVSTDWNPGSGSWGNRGGTTPYQYPSQWQVNSYQSGDWGNLPPVQVSKRNQFQEDNWWNPEATEGCKGPGMLPPLLADNLHNPDHTLFVVRPLVPETLDAAPSTSPTPAIKPTMDEITKALPHPDAFYCPKDNGWVIIHSSLSERRPPLARSFQAKLPQQLIPESPDNDPLGFPDCLDTDENRTHHFHKYEKAFDGRYLSPSYYSDAWDAIETVKQKRRAGAIITADLDLEKMKADAEEEPTLEDQDELLFDLYVCCQCQRYCVASPLIPGVLGAGWEPFLKDKAANPPPGKTPQMAVVRGVETLMMYVCDVSSLFVILTYLWIARLKTYFGKASDVCCVFNARASSTRWGGILLCRSPLPLHTQTN